MGPAIRAIGAGVAPVKNGNENCPSRVKYTDDLHTGVPITLSTAAYDSGDSVVIDENTDVYISFNASVCIERKAWGYRYARPLPSEVILELTTPERIYERPSFRIRKGGPVYLISSPLGGINYYLDATEDKRLVLSSEGPSIIPFIFSEAKDDQDMIIKSVV